MTRRTLRVARTLGIVLVVCMGLHFYMVSSLPGGAALRSLYVCKNATRGRDYMWQLIDCIAPAAVIGVLLGRLYPIATLRRTLVETIMASVCVTAMIPAYWYLPDGLDTWWAPQGMSKVVAPMAVLLVKALLVCGIACAIARPIRRKTSGEVG